MSYFHQSLLGGGAQCGSSCITTLSLTLALDGGGWFMSCPWEKDQVPIVREAGCVLWPGGKSCPHQDLIPGHAACSLSLFLLHCPSPPSVTVTSH